MGRLIITIAFFSGILSAQQIQNKAVLTDVKVETTQDVDRVIVVTDKPLENYTSFSLPEFGFIVLYLYNTVDGWSPHQMEVKKGVIDNIQSLYEEKLEITKIRIGVTELLPFEVTKKGSELILDIKNPSVNKAKAKEEQKTNVRAEKEQKAGIETEKEQKAGVGAEKAGVLAEKEKEVVSEKEGEGEGVYLLGPEDVMEIIIWEHPEFSTRVVIDPLGNIPFSLFGDVKAEGLTKEQLKDEIQGMVSKFIDDPNVLITIIEYRSKYVSLLGEVARPGRYALKKNAITLSEALYLAGLPTKKAALKRARLIRCNSKGKVEIIDISRILYKGDKESDIKLYSDDTLYIPADIPSKIVDKIEKITSPIAKALFLDQLFGNLSGN